ncbi:MAG: NAD(P)-dependent oxidoreductase [Gammaproteobacteria bacterium]|nr:NAD(P)-dependent oxidoreductase [Gammaproteobacteria bacterium]
MTRVAFIGLGVMGYPMAGHLARAAHAVTVFNRTTSKAERWIAEYRGEAARTPRAAAHAAAVVFSCVGNDDDLREVVSGADGAFAGMAPGSLFVDHSTTSARVARELAVLAAERQIEFIDAPVSGGQVGAEKGVLTIMAGGNEAAYQQAAPLLGAYAKSVRRIGPVGAGQLTKMVNQICCAGVIQGLAEGLNFGLQAGLDMEEVVAVIANGAAQSWQMDNRAHTMLNGEYAFGFAVDWMRKDLGIVLDEARRNGADLPTTAVIDQFFGELQRRQRNRWDTSSLMTLLRDR